MPIYVSLGPKTPEERARERREHLWFWGFVGAFVVFLGLCYLVGEARRKAEAKKPKEPERPTVVEPVRRIQDIPLSYPR